MSIVLAALGCMAVTACSTTGINTNTGSVIHPANWITPYRADVIQGNFVSKEQVDVLAVGMSRAQTRDLLGTPLLASLFHANRWDYVFTLQRQNAEPQIYKYTVFFEGDKLARFEGDAMPSEAVFLTKLDNQRKLGAVPVLEATDAQLNAAEQLRSAVAPVSAASAVPQTPTTPTDYPPLESAKP